MESRRLEDETGAIKFTEEKHHLVPDVQTTEGIVSNVLSADDDPAMQAWTFRSVFLGIGIGIFSSVLGEIYYFKPQALQVSTIFLVMCAYVLGEFWSFAIPRRGILKWINPFHFNMKEHAVIQIISSTASYSAIGAEVLTVQRLWYNSKINSGIGIFMLFSSQLIGYGFVGLLRNALVYPTDMLYPNSIPVASTLQALHMDKANVKKKLKIFYISFAVMFVYEILPEYIFLLLIGFSIPCLAAPNSSVVSHLFGGANGNEGLGLLSFCFDWQYIASVGNPMVIPIIATMNALAGYVLCNVVFMGVYYGNVWEAQRFPFLSQLLYYGNSTAGDYYIYDQTLILDANNHLNSTALQEQGIPWMTPTYVIYLIATNLSVGATLTWMYLFHRDVVGIAFRLLTPSYLKQVFNVRQWNWRFWKSNNVDPRLNRDGSLPKMCHDPHFRAYLAYKDTPQWWYTVLFLIAFLIGMIIIYEADSGLPWWAFIVSLILAFIFMVFIGGTYAMFAFGGSNVQTVVQMIGSYIHPGNPMANMYFTLYGYNSVGQGFHMMNDLKLGIYVKLAPRSVFAAQVLGTLIGSIFNYIIMNQIVTAQFDVLKSIEGTPIWSGQAAQQYNTQGISWGALAKDMFSAGKRYEFVPIALAVGIFVPIPFYIAHRLLPKWHLDLINVPIFIWYMGWLVVGVNSSVGTYFIVAIMSQWYFRRYHPILFQEYNYLLSAGLSGGTQVLVFILSFATNGAAGTAHPFPDWWGNHNVDAAGNHTNVDHCLYVN